jgi:hypothetical protein
MLFRDKDMTKMCLVVLYNQWSYKLPFLAYHPHFRGEGEDFKITLLSAYPPLMPESWNCDAKRDGHHCEQLGKHIPTDVGHGVSHVVHVMPNKYFSMYEQWKKRMWLVSQRTSSLCNFLQPVASSLLCPNVLLNTVLSQLQLKPLLQCVTSKQAFTSLYIVTLKFYTTYEMTRF